MKKIIFSIFVLLICNIPNVYAADIWDGTSDSTWYNNSKTSFEITTAEELSGLAQLVNSGVNFDGKNIILKEDIDLKNHPWSPIGNSSSNVFSGNFDGENHTISNLTDGNGKSGHIDTGSYGLFGYIANTNNPLEIKNLNLTNVNIKQTSSGKGVGALISYAHESAAGYTIKNVNVSGTIEGIYHVGGVIGKTYSGGEILLENITNTAEVTNKGYGMTGGIIGIFSHTGSLAKPNATIKNVKNQGTISNKTTNTTYTYSNAMQVSGIIGNVNSAKTINFIDCENTGKISSPGLRQMSGIANIENAENLIFENNVNKGNIEATNFNNYNTDMSTSTLNHLGGLFANSNVTKKILIKGTNTNYGTIGTLDGDKVYSGNYAGGIFGSINFNQNNITIELENDAKLVNEGTVYSKQYAGGIAGIYKASSNISSGTLENKGDINALYNGNNEMSGAGGIFGTIINLTTSALSNGFTGTVENSEISASGYGENIHTGNDNAVAAGGYIGYNQAFNISNSNIFIINSTINTNAKDNSYNEAYSGGIFGLIKLTSDNPEVGFLNNLIVNKTTINGKYAGEILGAAYDSYYASGRNLLNVTGKGLIKENEVNSTNEVYDKHLGVKINKAYITLDIIEKYKVYFETNGGTEKEYETVDVYSKVNKPQNIEKEGYTLDGWYTDENFENEYNFDNKIENDITLYAKWKEIENSNQDETDKENSENIEKPNTEEIENPQTGDNISTSILIFAISILGLLSSSVLLKKNN